MNSQSLDHPQINTNSDHFNYNSTVPREVTRLAEALSRLHGPSIIRDEKNGYHIYLPSPECLKTDGRKELQSRHLTVNASKYCELPEWVAKNKKPYDKDFSAVCHKTDTKYRVSDLLDRRKFKPLEERGIPNAGTSVTSAATARSASLVDDGRGNMIPAPPGEVVPITSLPPFHPAVEYLQQRGYNLQSLYHQLNCSFCVSEYPEDAETGIYYKRLPQGFRDTPQGRIIFYSFIEGVQVGWQARIMDRVVGNVKEYWHPYANQWVPMEGRDPVTNKWATLPGTNITGNGFNITWSPSKYKTAFGMSRNNTLMGVDAAVNWSKALGFPKSTAALVEGPLDAGRIGAGGIAMLGKYLSMEQADMLCKRFRRLLMVMDNDAAGEEATKRVKIVMMDRLTEVIFVKVPDEYKDIGEMTSLSAAALIYKYLI